MPESLPDGHRRHKGLYRRQAMMRAMAGVRQLARGRLIVTDRLHMHILSTLIRRPHVVLDNSYGKISRYLDAFGTDDLTIKAGSLKELQEALAG